MSSSKDIVLDLNRPLSHFHFSSSHKDSTGQLLQIRAIERIDDLIRSIQKEASAAYNPQEMNECNGEYHSGNFHPTRSNNTIFVDGDRGAGKTTFLRAYLDRFRTNSPIDLKQVHPIPLIDPTLISTHQHFLVDIIASIVKEVNKKSNCCLDEIKYSEFKKNLEEMAGGLKLLKDSDNQKQYDAAWFLNKAISSSTRGQSLEVCFHKVIDSALTILGKEIILIAIDDVDTKTTKANEVLETIRCYLTHPRMIIMLSGDFALYSHIVRKNKEDELGETNFESKKDKVGVEKRGRLVETLQLQYLSKVLPIEQRVQLEKLDSLSKEYNIKIKHSRLADFPELVDDLDEDVIDLKKLIKTMFSQSLYINNRHQDSHLSFIFSQPVRTILQTLKSMIEWEKVGGNESQQFHSTAFKQTLYNNYLGCYPLRI
ncbi:hypothetical protein MSP8887_01542 [Marinomonas spartinae]|uniref:P-loop NTPase fold protein n=1 Tax=Marinomonas spartinae TaxID=1792290 RepID=UPI000808D209|nr:P-loop NTPase fold protein [Marinomonas spartinae]SBS31560.1 hypothetical protein MSP8887_01542 [Marinomonas spartinae]